jgi:hypothetical protein
MSLNTFYACQSHIVCLHALINFAFIFENVLNQNLMYICFGNESQIADLEICRNNSNVLYKCIVDDLKMVILVVDHTFQVYNIILTVN